MILHPTNLVQVNTSIQWWVSLAVSIPTVNPMLVSRVQARVTAGIGIAADHENVTHIHIHDIA